MVRTNGTLVILETSGRKQNETNYVNDLKIIRVSMMKPAQEEHVYKISSVHVFPHLRGGGWGDR